MLMSDSISLNNTFTYVAAHKNLDDSQLHCIKKQRGSYIHFTVMITLVATVCQICYSIIY